MVRYTDQQNQVDYKIVYPSQNEGLPFLPTLESHAESHAIIHPPSLEAAASQNCGAKTITISIFLHMVHGFSNGSMGISGSDLMEVR